MNTILVAENEYWTAGVEFAAAMRHRGYRVVRLVAESAEELSGSAARRMLESLASETIPDAVRADGSLTDRGIDVLETTEAIDVQGTESVISWLSQNGQLDERRYQRSSAVRPEQARDKLLMTRFAESAGIPVPRTWDGVAGIRSGEQFPMMVKVREGSGGIGIQVCRNREELDKVVAGLDCPYVIQRYHEAPPLDVAGVAHEGQVTQLITYQNRHDPRSPFTYAYGVTVTEDVRLAEFARAVVAAFGITGPFALDAVPDDDGTPLLIDANLRVWGGWTGCHAAGLDVLGAYEHSLGLRPPPGLPQLRPGEYHSLMRIPPLGIDTRQAQTRWLAAELRTAVSRSSWMGPRWATIFGARAVNWALRGSRVSSTLPGG